MGATPTIPCWKERKNLRPRINRRLQMKNVVDGLSTATILLRNLNSPATFYIPLHPRMNCSHLKWGSLDGDITERSRKRRHLRIRSWLCSWSSSRWSLTCWSMCRLPDWYDDLLQKYFWWGMSLHETKFFDVGPMRHSTDFHTYFQRIADRNILQCYSTQQSASWNRVEKVSWLIFCDFLWNRDKFQSAVHRYTAVMKTSTQQVCTEYVHIGCWI